MSTDRRMRLWTLVIEEAHGVSVTIDHVGSAAITAAGVDGAAISVVLPASPRENVYASDRAAADMEDLTTTLGEGPGVDALTNGPALAADLDARECQARWPVFAPAAVAAGVRAVFALPLQVGGIHLGVMDLYRSLPGRLDHEQLADALLLADTACALLLDSTTGASGHLPEEVGLHYPEVHQATGMIIAQVGVTAAVALIRLRAYAYAHDRQLRDVAASIVNRELRFQPDTQDSDT
jgi:GAF domain-containing protein